MTQAVLQLSPVPLGLAAGVVVLAGAAGVADVLRWQRWTWARAHRSRPAWLAVVAFLPAFGLSWYLLRVRPGVERVARRGRAAHLPFERYVDRADAHGGADVEEVIDPDPPALRPAPARDDRPDTIGGLRSPFGTRPAYAPVQRHHAEIDRAPHGAPAGTTRMTLDAPTSGRAPAAVLERPAAFRTRPAMTRPAMTLVEPSAAPAVGTPDPAEVDRAGAAVPLVATVPLAAAGWLADPTGRHHHRWWDGALWTDCVADAGAVGRDPAAT